MKGDSWNWKDFMLALPGFAVIRLYTGQDIVEMSLKVKEQAGERQSLELAFNSQTFGEFIESLKKINSKVEKKDFGSKSLKYNFSSESKTEFIFYFNKDEFKKFYRFLENCYKEIQEQEIAYKNLTKGK